MKVKPTSPEQLAEVARENPNSVRPGVVRRAPAEADGVVANYDRAQAINDNLNPERIAQERRDRVQQIKDTVASRTYRVPSKEMAGAVDAGISEFVDMFRARTREE